MGRIVLLLLIIGHRGLLVLMMTGVVITLLECLAGVGERKQGILRHRLLLLVVVVGRIFQCGSVVFATFSGRGGAMFRSHSRTPMVRHFKANATHTRRTVPQTNGVSALHPVGRLAARLVPRPQLVPAVAHRRGQVFALAQMASLPGCHHAVDLPDGFGIKDRHGRLVFEAVFKVTIPLESTVDAT